MTNSRLSLESAKPIAEKITKQMISRPDDDMEFVRNAFRALLGMAPGDVELKASEQAMEKWRHMQQATSETTRSYLVWSLLNHNDFVTLR
jgi:hypothetical protein